MSLLGWLIVAAVVIALALVAFVVVRLRSRTGRSGGDIEGSRAIPCCAAVIPSGILDHAMEDIDEHGSGPVTKLTGRALLNESPIKPGQTEPRRCETRLTAPRPSPPATDCSDGVSDEVAPRSVGTNIVTEQLLESIGTDPTGHQQGNGQRENDHDSDDERTNHHCHVPEIERGQTRVRDHLFRGVGFGWASVVRRPGLLPEGESSAC